MALHLTKVGPRTKTILSVLLLSLLAGGFAVGPARADDGWRHHRGWREHAWRGHEWRGRHRRPVFVAPGYYVPGYAYAAPPVIYAPRPVYAPPPGISVVVPLTIR